jgi:hypothetical protein
MRSGVATLQCTKSPLGRGRAVPEIVEGMGLWCTPYILNTDNITNQGKEFNLKEHLQVRSNFDQLFAGKYEKTLDPKVKDYVESKADELYLKEPGQKKSDRSSQLWKSLRNVEVLKYDRSLWDTVQQTVVEQPRDARDNVLTSPVGVGPKMPGHTLPNVFCRRCHRPVCCLRMPFVHSSRPSL